MTSRRTRRLAGLVALPATLALVIVTAATAPPATAAEPGPVKIPQRYLDQKIDWALCDFDPTIKSNLSTAPDTNCATVLVPMDWNDPSAHQDIELAIAYSKGTESQGLMAMNPGGPGAEGLTLSAAIALSKPDMFEQFDLLGFDPRGFGQSTNVQCMAAEKALAALPVTPDYRERTRETHKVEVEEAKLYAEACASDEFAPFVSTQQTVYDLDFLRALLGDYDVLNYIGFSYGTWLATWYADTYPDRVGRFVIDSNMEWTDTHYDNQVADSFSFERRRDQMLFPWIARHATEYDLGTTADAVSKRYEKVRAELVAKARDGEDTTGADLDQAIVDAIYSDSAFPEAAEAIQAYEDYAFNGGENPAPADSVDRSIPTMHQRMEQARAEAKKTEAPVELGAIGGVVRCNDSPWDETIATLLKDADTDSPEFPFIGYWNTVSLCSYWPTTSEGRTVDLPNVPQMLMLQSEGDPATAYEGAAVSHRKTADQTRLVSVDNLGQHGVYAYYLSDCAEAVADDYIFKGELPDSDVVCTDTVPLPGDEQVYKLDGPIDGNSYPIDDPSTPQAESTPTDQTPTTKTPLDQRSSEFTKGDPDNPLLKKFRLHLSITILG